MAAAERDRIQKPRIQGLHNTHAEVGGSSKVQSDDKARGKKKVHLREFLFFTLCLISIRADNSCPGEKNKASTLSAERIYITQANVKQALPLSKEARSQECKG